MNAGMEAVKRLMSRLSHTTLSSQQYRETVIARLREVVPFDGACCTAVDPHTLLSTGAMTEEGVESIHHALFQHEYLHEDFNQYDRLIHAAEPVATLSGATEGDLERSRRYCAVLKPAGFRDEMRAVLMSEGACWGYLTLFRRYDRPLFDEEERIFIASIAPLLAGVLRRSALSLPTEEPSGMRERMGIMVLTDSLLPISCSPSAMDWLKILRGLEQIDEGTLPRPIRAVCTRALAEAANLPDRQSPSKAKVCLRIPDGAYLSLRASTLLDTSGSVQLAVSFEPAKPSEILPLIAEAYALSAREKQIVDYVFRGYSTKELAEVLHISAYTVQDHLKSIFAKTGVKSRRALIWLLFSKYSLD